MSEPHAWLKQAPGSSSGSVERRRLLKLGSLATALTGASALSGMAVNEAEASNPTQAVRVPTAPTQKDLSTVYISTLIAKGPGIDPTGQSDSTQALQTLVDSAATLGAAVSFPPGIYRINQLRLGPLTRLVGLGAGTTRFCAEGITAPLVIFKHQTSSVLPMIIVDGGGITIENIEMHANYSSFPLLRIENGFESKLNNVRLLGVKGTALFVKRANNTKWYDVFVDNCGSKTSAAVVIMSPPQSEGNQTNTLDIYNLTIERCQNVALDLAYGGTIKDGYYAEFVRITNLHIEAPNDSGGLPNVDPLFRIGNVRNLHLVNPLIYGGGGFLIEHATTDVQTQRLKNGVFLIGGTLLGQEGNVSPFLVHLSTGDDFSLVGVRAGRFTKAVMKVDPTYGSRVMVDSASSLDGETGVWLEDARTGSVTLQANKSIGGSGTTGVSGGSVTTVNATGGVRNILDDGSGASTISGILSLTGGTRWINRTVTSSQSLTLADMGIISTATTPISLTLPTSSNSIFHIKNAGSKALVVAAPLSGTSPNIDGVAKIVLMPGEGALLSGRSSSVGSWIVVSHSVEHSGVGRPMAIAGPQLGVGAPSPLLDAGSNDLRGRIQATPGTLPSSGALLSLNFGVSFQSIPFVQICAASPESVPAYISKITNSGFELSLPAIPATNSGSYIFNYAVSP